MNQDAAASGGKDKLPLTFWLANMFEFFERGAYYGLQAVLAVYLVEHLEFSKESVGFLQGFVYALTYIVPIAGGALAERLGYRKMLLVAFSMMSIGYFAAGNVTSYGLVFLFLLIMATGSGLFKPIITGTIARTTTEENSGFGFGLYYWCINLGAFVTPFIVNILRGFSWNYVFLMSAIWCFAMLIPTVFFYKDPEGKPKSTKSAKETINEALMVLGDSRFMLMILVYSGFWILYFQMFGSALWYMRDFVNRTIVTEWMAGIPLLKYFSFDAEFVTIINALVIILLVIPVSRMCKDMPALPVMASGIVMGALGFVVLGFTSGPWWFLVGISIFSIGEMIAHPKYYSYVGKVAPKDTVAVYMGYGFLYGVIGSLFGSNFGAILYDKLLTPIVPDAEGVQSGVPLSPMVLDKIHEFWLIFAAVGAVCVVGMLLYNKFFAEDTPTSNKRAWHIMILMYGILFLGGVYFFSQSTFMGDKIVPKTLVQSIIMLLLGGGGITLSLKRRGELA